MGPTPQRRRWQPVLPINRISLLALCQLCGVLSVTDQLDEQGQWAGAVPSGKQGKQQHLSWGEGSDRFFPSFPGSSAQAQAPLVMMGPLLSAEDPTPPGTAPNCTEANPTSSGQTLQPCDQKAAKTMHKGHFPWGSQTVGVGRHSPSSRSTQPSLGGTGISP